MGCWYLQFKFPDLLELETKARLLGNTRKSELESLVHVKTLRTSICVLRTMPRLALGLTPCVVHREDVRDYKDVRVTPADSNVFLLSSK